MPDSAQLSGPQCRFARPARLGRENRAAACRLSLFPAQSTRGAALVIVLSFLVLVTIMAVAFFATTAGESAAAKNQADSLGSRQLADSTLQFLIGQIRQATSGGSTTGWASQPGMIRTYDNSGNPSQAFKLYSAASMIDSISGNYSPSSIDMPPTTWQSDKPVWTDLNAPVQSSSGNMSFPIIDPRAAATVSGNNSLVEGFSYDASAVAGAKAADSTDDSTARLPMPVRWLYMLKDGTFTAPSGGSGTKADFSGSNPEPSDTNPIVGRVAFWTDDETCKLNLNTAAGGNFWDIPSYTAGIELHFSRYKPIKNEFARYPGHPATTSLSPVLWSYGGLSSPHANLFPTMNPPTPYRYSSADYTAAAVAEADVTPSLSSSAQSFFQKCLQLNPRNEWGGSAMGSRATVIGRSDPDPAQPLDGDRLFASVDEALYGMPSASGNSTRPANPFNLAPSDIEKLRFFLTTQSRAPDTNPLSQPKVGIWPIAESPAKRTPTDKLIAFCSTLNGEAYYFTRNNSDDPEADFKPGSRNDQVFDYLDTSLQNNIPGFGGSLGDRYGVTGTRRILTQIYDYMRGSVNLTDTYSSVYAGRGNLTAPFAFVPPRIGSFDKGRGQVVPIQINKGGQIYKGHGRFITVKQVALQFIAVAANQPPCLIDANGEPTTTPNPMHPWVGPMPTSVTTTPEGNGTWTINATNAYRISNSANVSNSTISLPREQTHAGLPLLPTKWISSNSLYTATDNASVSLRNGCLNPRYQGSASLYGAGGEGLPDPFPVAAPGKLGPHQTLIQAAVLVDTFLVNPGLPPFTGDYQLVIKGMNSFTAAGQNMGFPNTMIQIPNVYPRDAGLDQPGFFGISTHLRSTNPTDDTRIQEKLQFISNRVLTGNSTFSFTGGSITIEIRTKPSFGDPTSPANLGKLIQTVELEFPDAIFPTPLLPPMPHESRGGGKNQLLSADATASGVALLTPSSLLTFDGASPLSRNPNFGVGATVFAVPGAPAGTPARTRAHFYFDDYRDSFVLPERMTDPSSDEGAKLTCDTIRSVELLYGDARVISGLNTVGKEFFKPHMYYDDITMRSAHTLRLGSANIYTAGNSRGATDHVLSDAILSDPSFSYADTSLPEAKAYRGEPATSSTKIRSLGAQSNNGTSSTLGRVIRSTFPHVTSSVDFNDTTFQAIWRNGGDFDTGPALSLDGGFIGKSNEGGTMLRHMGNFDGRNTNPDFNSETFEFALENLNNSPNRQVSSPVMFGSLPVGSTPQESWRTLLFCPNPNSGNHTALSQINAAGQAPAPGMAPDYLLLDFFNMPVVEPYAISEPFSTAGRVNMNCQIAPFSHIRRDTALRGVLRTGMLTAVEDSKAPSLKMRITNSEYAKNSSYSTFLQSTGHWAFRFPIHIGETLKQFDQRFSNGDIFRSPAEICSLWLYPGRQPTSTAPENSSIALVNWDSASSNIKGWWYNNPGGTRKSLTADNMRERPYSTLYPRLTTKSNTYTTYFRVQTLQKNPTTSATEWDESRDRVGSEFRGSAMVERYIDPSDPNIPDFTNSANANTSLDNFYRYRVMNMKRFAP